MLQPYERQFELTRNVRIEPHLIGCNIHRLAKSKVWRAIKGLCTIEIGFVMRLEKIKNIVQSKIDPVTGNVIYKVDFVVTTFKPEIGKPMLAQIKSMSANGIFADLGPLNIFIPRKHIPTDYNLEYKKSFSQSPNDTNDEIRYCVYASQEEDKEDIRIGDWKKMELLALKKLDTKIEDPSITPEYYYIGGELKAVAKLLSESPS